MSKIQTLFSVLKENPIAAIVTVVLGAGTCGISSLFLNASPLTLVERLFWPVTFVESSVGSGGSWHEVYFTDPPQTYDAANFRGEIPDALINRINAAQESIDIAAFDLDVTPIADALIAAHNRGVRVRWFTDEEHGLGDNAEEGGQFRLMREAGILIRDDDREPLMHNKFIIFDDAAVWTGSTNLTQNGLFRNNNNVIIFQSEAVARIYSREFRELWRGNSGSSSRSTVRLQTAVLEDTPVLVLFGPEDDGMDRLVELVRGADESIQFLAFAFTHDELGQELLRRARRGVDVRGVFEERNINNEFSEIHRLACHGLDVRIDGNPANMHHKVFIIDGTIVVTGSFNFSNNADQSNDENMVFLNNAQVGASYQQEFRHVWDQALPPNPVDLYCP